MSVGRALLVIAVPIPEYVLLSEPLFRCADERVRRCSRPLEQELEGLGRVPTYFMDLAEIAADPPPGPEVTPLGRFRENVGVVLRSFSFLLGLRKPRFAQPTSP